MYPEYNSILNYFYDFSTASGSTHADAALNVTNDGNVGATHNSLLDSFAPRASPTNAQDTPKAVDLSGHITRSDPLNYSFDTSPASGSTSRNDLLSGDEIARATYNSHPHASDFQDALQTADPTGHTITADLSHQSTTTHSMHDMTIPTQVQIPIQRPSQLPSEHPAPSHPYALQAPQERGQLSHQNQYDPMTILSVSRTLASNLRTYPYVQIQVQGRIQEQNQDQMPTEVGYYARYYTDRNSGSTSTSPLMPTAPSGLYAPNGKGYQGIPLVPSQPYYPSFPYLESTPAPATGNGSFNPNGPRARGMDSMDQAYARHFSGSTAGFHVVPVPHTGMHHDPNRQAKIRRSQDQRGMHINSRPSSSLVTHPFLTAPLPFDHLSNPTNFPSYQDGMAQLSGPFARSGLGINLSGMVNLQHRHNGGSANTYPAYMPNESAQLDDRDRLALAALQVPNANQSTYFPPAEGSYLTQNSLPVRFLPYYNPSGTVSSPDTPHAGPSSQPSAATPTRRKKAEKKVDWQADLLEALSARGQTPIPTIHNTNIDELRHQLETSQRPEVVRFQPFGLRSLEDPDTFYYPIFPSHHSSLSTASSLLRAMGASPAGVIGFIRVSYGKFLQTHQLGRRPRPANFTVDRGRGRPGREKKWWRNGLESRTCVCGKVFNSPSGFRDHIEGGISKAGSATMLNTKKGSQRDTYASDIPKTRKSRKTKAKAKAGGPTRTHNQNPEPAEDDAAVLSSSPPTDPSVPAPAAADRKRNTDKVCYVMQKQFNRTRCFYCDAHLTPPKSKDWKVLEHHLLLCKPLAELRSLLHPFHREDDGLTSHQVDSVSWPVRPS